MSEQNKNLEVIMALIMHSGNAKSLGMEAIQLAKQDEWEQVSNKMEEANQELEKAHQSQTGLLSRESSGENMEVTLLMVHAQDHLMNAITFCDLANELIELYDKK